MKIQEQKIIAIYYNKYWEFYRLSFYQIYKKF